MTTQGEDDYARYGRGREEQTTPADRQQQTPYPLRMPSAIRDELEACADRNGRSLNAEILQRIALSMGDSRHEAIELRDHFAGLAMQGILANERCNQVTSDVVARWSYAQADDMLAERAKGA